MGAGRFSWAEGPVGRRQAPVRRAGGRQSLGPQRTLAPFGARKCLNEFIGRPH